MTHPTFLGNYLLVWDLTGAIRTLAIELIEKLQKAIFARWCCGLDGHLPGQEQSEGEQASKRLVPRPA
jgi:hypothetical protein